MTLNEKDISPRPLHTPDSISSSKPMKREIFGWAMFDFANSSYTTVVITVVFSSFFTKYIVPFESKTRDSYWSLAILISVVLALIVSPFLGVITDITGRKKQFLLLSAVGCAMLTACLYFVNPGNVWFAISIVALSNFMFMLSESFCASFLPEISNEKNVGWISGLGWGLGYFGGLGSLALVLSLIPNSTEKLVANLDSSNVIVTAHQQAMLATGLFFLVSCLPTFYFLKGKEPKNKIKLSVKDALKLGIRELKTTVNEAQKYKNLFRFLWVFLLYMAGVDVIIKFVGIYANQELGFSMADLTKVFLVIQVSAALGAVGFGGLESKIGAKRTLFVSLWFWVVSVLAIIFLTPLSEFLSMSPKDLFFGIALFSGTGLGSVQSCSRSIVSQLCPPEKSGEMFGFWGMFMRAATILGTGFGFLSDFLGSRTQALYFVLFLLFAGILFLTKVTLTKPHQEQVNKS
jgi:MFS transporter, UMF1 family